MPSIVYGLKQTRIILYQDDAVTPLYRVTLQKETKEGLELAFKPEGIAHKLGSGAGWSNVWIHRGYRLSLAIKWTHGLDSSLETWDAGSSAWGPSAALSTPQALGLIHSRACRAPARVSPHLDLALDFLAQPDPGKAFILRDLKRVVHTGLELDLVANALLSDIPDWPTLNNYFETGFIDPDFITAQP